ncbi:putative lysosomal cobalamin transporter, partial [Saccoglossus kowalevskii]
MAVIPHSVLAVGWIPFAVVFVLIVIFAFLYARFYRSKRDSETCTTVIGIISLTVALLTIALVPVDIFLVSYMKCPDGTFKDWADNNSTRDAIEDMMLYAYYTMYTMTVFMLFLVLPFTYFFYEEYDFDSTTKS